MGNCSLKIEGVKEAGNKTEEMATEVGRKQEMIMSWKHSEGRWLKSETINQLCQIVLICQVM